MSGSELVPGPLELASYFDTSAKTGVGGVWFSMDGTMPPIVWRVPFPEDIVRQVVSELKPKAS